MQASDAKAAQAHPEGFVFSDMDFPSPAWVGVVVYARRKEAGAVTARHRILMDLKGLANFSRNARGKINNDSEVQRAVGYVSFVAVTPIWHNVRSASIGRPSLKEMKN
jgi:hypothetical protein